MDLLGPDDRRWTIVYTTDENAPNDRHARVNGPLVRLGESLDVVPAQQLEGAVAALEEIRTIAARPLVRVDDDLYGRIVVIASKSLRALRNLGGQ